MLVDFFQIMIPGGEVPGATMGFFFGGGGGNFFLHNLDFVRQNL